MVDAAAGGDAGIVADHMDISERFERGLRRALDAGGVGDVADDAAHAGANSSRLLTAACQRVRLDIGEHHLHAGFRKGLRRAQSPMPAAPPVTNAVLPAKSRMAVPLLGFGASLLA